MRKLTEVRSVPLALILVAACVAACAAPIPSVPPTASSATTTPAAPSVLAPSVLAPSVVATPAATPVTPTPDPSADAGPTPTPMASCDVDCVQPAAIYKTHGPRTVPAVALTFDDGFNVPACISIVNTLLAKHVTATFFPNGQYVRENPSFWNWVAANGFPVGSHMTTHHDATKLSAALLLLNLSSERRILDETLGTPSINAFRPPYGSFNARVLAVSAEAGYPIAVGWDVDSKDQLGAPSVAAEVANATAGTNGSIVLMHCGSALTPLALPAIIDRYLARGFALVTVPQLLGLAAPAFGWAPPTSPDLWATTGLAATDPVPSWNASPAIDASGRLHVAYETPAGIVVGDDASGTWASETLAPSTTSTFESRPGIAVDSSGGAHLVYLSSTVSGTELMYRYRPAAGSWSAPVTVAKLGAPASTASIVIDGAGLPVIAYVVLGGPHPGTALARPIAGGWGNTMVPGTNGTFVNASVAIDRNGAIHLVERRNGYSEIDETTNASGTWITSPLLRVAGSAVPFAAFDPSGRLVVAAQATFGEAVTLGVRTGGALLDWTTVAAVGDLSGLAIGADGIPLVAFSRIGPPGSASRIWLARSPSR